MPPKGGLNARRYYWPCFSRQQSRRVIAAPEPLQRQLWYRSADKPVGAPLLEGLDAQLHCIGDARDERPTAGEHQQFADRRLVMTVLPRSWRNHNLRQELWFHVRPPFSFDPTALPSHVGRVLCRGSQEAGAQGRPAASEFG